MPVSSLDWQSVDLSLHVRHSLLCIATVLNYVVMVTCLRVEHLIKFIINATVMIIVMLLSLSLSFSFSFSKLYYEC